MEETATSKIVHAVVFIGICVAIVVMGWKEPLRYRFLSPQEIAEIESPAPEPTPSWVDSRFKGSRLDEPARPAGGVRSGPAIGIDQSRGSRYLDR